MRQNFIRLVLAAALICGAGAQVSTPVTPEVRAWKLPPVAEFKLENGLTVDLLEDSRFAMVQARLMFASGSRRDPKDRPGLAATVADTLGFGTSNETASQIEENLGRAGGALSIKSTPDYIVFEGSAVPEGLPMLLSVMSDIARGASFPAAELGLYAQGRRQAIMRQISQAGYAANEFFFATLFGDHPYSRIVPPPAAPVTDAKALTAYRAAFLTPANGALIIAGKIPARVQVEKTITERFGVWTSSPAPAVEPGKIPAPARRLVMIDRPGLPVAEIRIGKIAPAQRDPEYSAVMVASVLANARARKLKTLPMKTDFTTLDEASVLMILAQATTANADGVLSQIVTLLDGIARQPIEPGELADAKTAANSSLLMRVQTQAGLADELARLKAQHLSADYLDTYTAHINAVSADQVREAAKKYLGTEDAAIIIEGDAAKLQPELAKTGSFEIIKAK